MQFVGTVVLPEFQRAEEILVEDLPPMAVISLARIERNQIIDGLGANIPPPRSYYCHRRLREKDLWYLEVCQASVGDPVDGKHLFFTQLVVTLDKIRQDVYAVVKVLSPFILSVFCLCSSAMQAHSCRQFIYYFSFDICICCWFVNLRQF
jgi:hypothetical protein